MIWYDLKREDHIVFKSRAKRNRYFEIAAYGNALGGLIDKKQPALGGMVLLR